MVLTPIPCCFFHSYMLEKKKNTFFLHYFSTIWSFKRGGIRKKKQATFHTVYSMLSRKRENWGLHSLECQLIYFLREIFLAIFLAHLDEKISVTRLTFRDSSKVVWYCILQGFIYKKLFQNGNCLYLKKDLENYIGRIFLHKIPGGHIVTCNHKFWYQFCAST